MFNNKNCFTIIALNVIIATSLTSCKKIIDINYDSLYEDNSQFLSLTPPQSLYQVSEYAVMLDYRKIKDSAPTDFFGKKTTYANGEVIRIIRKLKYDGIPAYIVINANNFNTSILRSIDIDTKTEPVSPAENLTSNLGKALDTYQDKTLKSISEIEKSSPQDSNFNFAITIDMCQSSKAWDSDLFNSLIKLGEEMSAPVSVGIAMTGLWAAGHKPEFAQLLQWKKSNKLKITWINHSYNHQVSKQSNGEYLFLTAPKIDFQAEVLALESMLLSQGEVFSVLFRFPGLVHNTILRKKLNDLSLFALDANAWLAKGQNIIDKAVVLVHGNGNERPGIKLILQEMEKRKSPLINGEQKILSPLYSLTKTIF